MQILKVEEDNMRENSESTKKRFFKSVKKFQKVFTEVVDVKTVLIANMNFGESMSVHFGFMT